MSGGGGDNNGGSSYDYWGNMTIPGGTGSVAHILPDFSGGLYAPIDYTPGASSYSHVPTQAIGDHGAENLNAQLIKEQFRDYQSRFEPFEDLAVNLLTPTGTKDLPYDIARTKEVVGGVFNTLQGEQDRAMERFGQTNKADNIAGSNTEASAMVGGLNGAVLADQERRMKLLGGGTSTASSALSDANGTGGN